MTNDQPETATISLKQLLLGGSPYTLIEMRPASDGSGEPALFVDAGGGAQEEPLYMPLLALTEHPAEGNPVAEMLREMVDTQDWDRETLEGVTRQFNPEWIPFVMRRDPE